MTKNNTSDCAKCASGDDFCVVGVDVSKHHLNVHEPPSGRSRQFGNTAAGIRSLRAWVCPVCCGRDFGGCGLPIASSIIAFWFAGRKDSSGGSSGNTGGT